MFYSSDSTPCWKRDSISIKLEDLRLLKVWETERESRRLRELEGLDESRGQRESVRFGGVRKPGVLGERSRNRSLQQRAVTTS